MTPISQRVITYQVNSYDEWSPLEEVIVGIADGTCMPRPDGIVRACTSPRNWPWLERFGGLALPADFVGAANRELDGLAKALTAEGIVVRRPEIRDHTRSCRTPDFESPGLYAAMPRDVIVVLGKDILVAPMAWRQRHFEALAYHGLLNRYFQLGCGLISGPPTSKHDTLYLRDYDGIAPEERNRLVRMGKFM